MDKYHFVVDLVVFHRNIDKKQVKSDSLFQHIHHEDIEYSDPYILIKLKVMSYVIKDSYDLRFRSYEVMRAHNDHLHNQMDIDIYKYSVHHGYMLLHADNCDYDKDWRSLLICK